MAGQFRRGIHLEAVDNIAGKFDVIVLMIVISPYPGQIYYEGETELGMQKR